MKPENTKRCPLCGGPLEQCRANIILSELAHQVHKGGLVLKTRLAHSFRCGYQCGECGTRFSVKQLSSFKEANLQHAAG